MPEPSVYLLECLAQWALGWWCSGGSYLLVERKEGSKEGRDGRREERGKNSISEIGISEKFSSAPGVDLSLFEIETQESHRVQSKRAPVHWAWNCHSFQELTGQD